MVTKSYTYSLRTLLIVTVIAAIASVWIAQERPKERQIKLGKLEVTRRFENRVYEIQSEAFGSLISTNSEQKELEKALKRNPQMLQSIAERIALRLDEQAFSRNQLGLLQRELLAEAHVSLGQDARVLKSVGLTSFVCSQVKD